MIKNCFFFKLLNLTFLLEYIRSSDTCCFKALKLHHHKQWTRQKL